MAAFIQKCPHCQSDLELQEEWKGMKAQCPVCSKHFIIALKLTQQSTSNKQANSKIEDTFNFKSTQQSTSNKQSDSKEDTFNFKSTQQSTSNQQSASQTFANRTDTPRTNFNSVQNNEYYDFEEDNFVLDTIEKYKKGNYIFFIFSLIILIVLTTVSFLKPVCDWIDDGRIPHDWWEDLLPGLIFLLGMFSAYTAYLIIKLILCWFRGVYRNLMLR